jgi:Bacteriophage holin.
MKEFKEKLKNYGFWLSLTGAVVFFLQACGIKVNVPLVDGAVSAFCGILIVLGIINNPNDGKFY